MHLSILNYLNSLLINLPDRQLDKLQRIQNITARIVSCCGRTNYITLVMASLHWLPVRARISFKVCLMVYCSIHGLAPAYIMDILSIYRPSRNLRSSENGVLLRVPNVRTSTMVIGHFLQQLLSYGTVFHLKYEVLILKSCLESGKRLIFFGNIFYNYVA